MSCSAEPIDVEAMYENGACGRAGATRGGWNEIFMVATSGF